MLSGLKYSIKKNVNDVRLFAAAKDLYVTFSAWEHEYRSFVKMISGCDSIADIEGFREAIKPALQKTRLFGSKVYGAESYSYGYYNELLHYAGRKREDIALIATFEHGVRFTSVPWEYQPHALSCVCQGRSRMNEIHRDYPWKLIFSLGPYIHYSRGYYDRERFNELKKTLGRVLLVFPSHSNEVSDLLSDADTVGTVMKKYAGNYDTVLVCMYWKNVNDPIAKRFESEGARVVSAGFREDRNFVRRLKTIIRLADDVVVDDLGTNIGFCMHMKKRVFFEAGERPTFDDELFVRNHKAFRDAFYTETKSFTNEQLAAQKKLYNEHWGGDAELLSVSETQSMFQALETICGMARYRLDRMPAAEKEFIGSCGDNAQRELIRRALAPKLKI